MQIPPIGFGQRFSTCLQINATSKMKSAPTIIENESLRNEDSRAETQPPGLWRVVLLNDDFTTVDFVVDVLTQFYGKMHEDAEIIALEIHFTGQGEAGIYTREIAEHKGAQTLARARSEGHPLRVVIEMVD